MRNYYAGIDVGTNSVGFSAVAVGEEGNPTELLNSLVVIHDSGVDMKYQDENRRRTVTRLASAGIARRTRRLYRRRKRRLRRLDEFISKDLGYPLVDLEALKDPYEPWKVRADLAQIKLPDGEFPEAMSIALRHMARHRGWRSPYQRVTALHLAEPPSDEFKALKKRVTEKTGTVFAEDATPAEVLIDLMGKQKIRGKEGILPGKLRQSDYANELRKIGAVQGIEEAILNKIIDCVFHSESPKGKASELVGKDELPGQKAKKRAQKADPMFQKFRIVAVVCNLRVKENQSRLRLLTSEEKQVVVDFLLNSTADNHVTWSDIAEKIEIHRDALQGTAEAGVDGEPMSRPPVNATLGSVLKTNNHNLIQFWKNADYVTQAALVKALSNAEILEDTEPGSEEVREFLSTLNEKELEKLDKIGLPAGRAAYSVDSLQRLTNMMLSDDCDLFEARKREFGVPDDWKPSAEPIYAPVGNPAVDRVLKIVYRWLTAAERRWGAPMQVNIEHVRSGFTSERLKHEYKQELKNRQKRNDAAVAEILKLKGGTARPLKSDFIRYYAIKRQNCQCVYCGDPITYNDCEMDHIVPRKGVGSTNAKVNLVAVCRSCNHSKSNIPFAVWAGDNPNPNINVEAACERVKQWESSENESPKEFRAFQNGVIARLTRTSDDPEIDSRSIESVAWMARELHHRIEYYFQSRGADTKVAVYQGRITAQARKASHLEDKVRMIGGGGKTRFDRRHHAMDAVTIAMMTPHVAKILAERNSLRDEQRITRKEETWKRYKGKHEGDRAAFSAWSLRMESLTGLFNEALDSNSIPVMYPLRLRLADSKAHDDTVNKLSKLPVRKISLAWTLEEIDCVTTSQIWTALTRCTDFDPQKGLPANPERVIRAQGVRYKPDSVLPVFPSEKAAILVRGGYAEIGSTIHHARIYRIRGKKDVYSMIRVFSIDLRRHRNEDLFSVELPPSSISIRTCDKKLRLALREGTAEYLGWLVVGDEVLLNTTNAAFRTGQIGKFLEKYPVSSFRIAGFPMPTKLRLKPTLLAGEGIPPEDVDSLKKIIEYPGWRPEVNVVFSKGMPRIIRRNSLGEERTQSKSRLPISWEV